MLRETSQSLPKMKLSPNELNAFCDWPISLMKKYASSARINAARIVSPYRSIWSGKRPADDRSNAERPPGAVVALASNYLDPYEIGDPLQVIFANCALSLVASEDGSGAYGS